MMTDITSFRDKYIIRIRHYIDVTQRGIELETKLLPECTIDRFNQNHIEPLKSNVDTNIAKVYTNIIRHVQPTKNMYWLRELVKIAKLSPRVANAVTVIDNCISMKKRSWDDISSLDVAYSTGMLTGYLNKGVFSNCIIPHHTRPTRFKFTGKTIHDKWKSMSHACCSTLLDLTTIVNGIMKLCTTQKELPPKYVHVFSDQPFESTQSHFPYKHETIKKQ